MALSDDRIFEIAEAYGTLDSEYRRAEFARTIEAEVRKSDEALVLQLVEALENSHATLWEEEDDPERPAHGAIAAARAWLEGKP